MQEQFHIMDFMGLMANISKVAIPPPGFAPVVSSPDMQYMLEGDVYFCGLRQVAIAVLRHFCPPRGSGQARS